jgi:hypothetical protein
MSWQYAYTYEIDKIIKSLKTKNTAGYDEISNRILKLRAPLIISPLTCICNAVLSTGVFPDKLKYAIVKTQWRTEGGGLGGSNPPTPPKFRNFDKVPKIKKILLYEMKFLVPNCSCLQNP